MKITRQILAFFLAVSILASLLLPAAALESDAPLLSETLPLDDLPADPGADIRTEGFSDAMPLAAVLPMEDPAAASNDRIPVTGNPGTVPDPAGDPGSAGTAPIAMGSLDDTGSPGLTAAADPASAGDTAAVYPMSTLPVTVTADTAITWSVDEAGVLTISGDGAMADYTSGTAPWYADYAAVITAVTVGDGVTRIGSYAFAGLSALTSVTLPDTLLSLGRNAFASCTSLAAVSLPDSITSIGFRCFYGCTSLTAVNIPRSWTTTPASGSGNNVDDTGRIFEKCTSLTALTVPEGITVLPSFAFNGCSDLEEVSLPSTLTEIKNHAFYGCTGLISVTVPDGVTALGKSAFCECTGLTSVSLPEGLLTLSLFAFTRCTALTSVELPDSITSIGYRCFYGCTGLTEINIPLSWKECPSSASDGTANTDYCGQIFTDCTSLKEITVSDGMTALPSFAFSSCNTLEYIHLPDSLTDLGRITFYGCTSLKEIRIPAGVTSIGKSLFNRCSALTSVEFAGPVTELAIYAFHNCSSLNSIVLPDTITSIGYQCFYNCSSLTTINAPRNWTDCPSGANDGTVNTTYCGRIFDGCTKLTKATVPEGMTALPSYAFNGAGYLKEISLPSTLTQIKNHTFYNCARLESIVVPDGVISTGKSAFCYCTSLRDVTLPESLTTLGLYTFYECIALESLRLPDSVSSIGFQCFAGCTRLSRINIPLSWNICPASGSDNNADDTGQIFLDCTSLKSLEVPEGITVLPSYAFNGCNYLEEVSLPSTLTQLKNHTFYKCSSLKSVDVPAGVTSIGKSAFCYAGALAQVQLPDGVTSLGHYAFKDCTSLESLRLPDSIRSIGFKCFENATALSQVNIPRSWTECSSGSTSGTISSSYCGMIFAGCSKLMAVAVPEGVTQLPDYAFNGCNTLKTILLPETLTAIGAYAFRDCTAMTSIAVPSGVTAIPAYAFYNCSDLAVVNLPDTVTSIAKYAFYSCPSDMTINYTGSSEAWEQVSVTSSGNSTFTGCEVTPDYQPVFSAKDIVAVWEGEYSGSHNDVEVRRHCVIVVKDCTDTGFMNGTVTFSISEEEDSTGNATQYAANGSYIFEGVFNPQTGILFFQGQIWLDYPDEYDNFTFVTFDGSLSDDKRELNGYNDGDTGRAFYTDFVGPVVPGNTRVTMTTDDKTYNLLTESVTIKENAAECVTITVTPDWGEAEPGSVVLRQKTTSEESQSGVFIDVYPGTMFSPDESIYAVLQDASGNVVDTIYLNLHIIHSDTSRHDQATNNKTYRIQVNKRENDDSKNEYVAAEQDLGHAIYADEIFWANASGVVSIPEQPGESVTFAQVGYQDRTLTPAQLANTPTVYLQHWKQGIPIISGVWMDDLDVMNYSSRIYYDDKTARTLTVEMDWNLEGEGIVELWQDGITAAFDDNGKLTVVFSEKFDLTSPIYIIATAESGAVCKRKLNITASAMPEAVSHLDGMSFSFSDVISLKLPGDHPFFGGAEISAGISTMIPVTVVAENGVVTVAVGLDMVNYKYSDTATTLGNGSTYHKLNRETKTFVDTFKGKVFDAGDAKEALKGLKDIEKKYKSAMALTRGSFAFEADFSVLGFIEGIYDSEGNLDWLDGGIIFKPSVSTEWGLQSSIGPVPVYLEAILKAEITARLNLFVAEQAKQIRPFGNVTGEISVRAGGGVGLRKVVGIGGGGKGTLTPYWTIRQNAEDYFRLTASLNLYFKAYLGPLCYVKDFDTLAEEVWIEYPSSAYAVQSVGQPVLGSMELYNMSNYTLPDLSYLNSASLFTANNAAAVTEDRASTETILKTNLYQQSEPKYLALSDSTALAVWLDSETDDINQIQLRYSYFDGTAWTDPQPVSADGTLDNNPVLKQVGSRIFLAWQNSSCQLDADTTPEAMAESFDISVAEFIPGTGFHVATLTQPALDMTPVICGSDDAVYAVWVNNSGNNWFGDNQSNRIYSACLSDGSWSTPAVVYSGLNSIDSIAADYSSGVLEIAYSMDTDGDLDTIDDLHLYVNGRRLTDSDTCESNPVYGDHRLYWYSAGSIVCGGMSTSAALPTDRYQLLEQNGTLLALYIESTGAGNRLMASYYDAVESCWSDAVALTDDSCNISAFSADAAADGTLELLMVRQSVTGTEEEPVYGDAELVLLTISQTCDLSVAEVFYDETAFCAGSAVNLSAQISNLGSTAVDAYTVTCTDEDGNVLTTLTRDTTLMPGETVEDYFSVTIPADAREAQVTVRVTADGRSDVNEADNGVTLTMRYENLRLEYLDWSLQADGTAAIYADVVNRGYEAYTDLTVNLYRDSMDGAPIAAETVASLDGLDLATVAFSVPYSENAVYYVQIVPVEGESLTTDNGGYLTMLHDMDLHFHDYYTETVAPTCTERGYTTYTCAGCGHSYMGDYVEAGHTYVDGICTVCGAEEGAEPVYSVTYTSASISLDGDIGVNYYTQLSEDLINAPGAYMRFTVAGENQDIALREALVSTGTDGVPNYRFTCKVAAKQMTDQITGQIYLSDGTAVGEPKIYSVKAYCDAAIPVYSQYAAYADLVALMEAMLNYGGYSQTQFGYRTDDLANAGVDNALPELTADLLSPYAHGADGSEAGIRVSSVSLLLESTTTIRFYFTLDGTRSIDEYTFYVDGVEVAPVLSGENQYYVDKVNIAAKDLDEMVTVTVGGLTARYCGLSYTRQVAVLYPNYYSAALVNVAKALYAYNCAANTYFES